MIAFVPILAIILLASGLALAYVIGAAAVLSFVAADHTRYLAILPQQLSSKIGVFALMPLPRPAQPTSHAKLRTSDVDIQVLDDSARQEFRAGL